MINSLTNQFQSARDNNRLVLLEGFHTIKHALRFGAEFEVICTSNKTKLTHLLDQLAPDIKIMILNQVTEVTTDEFVKLTERVHPTEVIAIAKRRPVDVPKLLAGGGAPIVLLENPRRLNNVGAAIRVAAAVGADGLLTTGAVDPWHTDALRGSAGLHYALNVSRLEKLPETKRPIIVLDDEGESLNRSDLPDNAIFAFGTEREGVSSELRAKATQVVSLPMREGVSSLNLATAVSAALYAWRLNKKSK